MDTTTSSVQVVTACHVPLFQVRLVGEGWDLDDWHVCAIVGWDTDGLPVVCDLEAGGILFAHEYGDGNFGVYPTFERACDACDREHDQMRPDTR